MTIKMSLDFDLTAEFLKVYNFMNKCTKVIKLRNAFKLMALLTQGLLIAISTTSEDCFGGRVAEFLFESISKYKFK